MVPQHVTLWENYVGRLERDKSYYLHHFNMQEYHLKKFLATPKQGAINKEINDIPCSVEAKSVTVEDNENIANQCQGCMQKFCKGANLRYF